MSDPNKLLSAMQSEWPLLSCLTLVGGAATPRWAIASAQRVALNLPSPALSVCRARLPLLVGSLAALHQRWVVALALAVLLALAVVSSAPAAPLDALHQGILLSVLSAILLPPLVIYNGIARDYVAARALAAVLCGGPQRTIA